ncbi:unnamed protein product, partial [Heligmosomoides polygyrus]|uniref:NR LBD domain-containing protein n=1 Tax=Heligmosomoides polygyrus TaxID=6339 RepID=A0A183G8J8_HELPZ
YCDAPEESLYISTPNCSIDISLEEALHFPQKISSRLPTNSTRQITVSNLKTMWCRQVAHYFEWVSGIPELRLMGMRERVSLSKLFLSAIPSFVFRSDPGYVRFTESGFTTATLPLDFRLFNYMNALTDVIQRNIVTVFREISITREEFLFMKLILMFDRKSSLTYHKILVLIESQGYRIGHKGCA